MNSSVVRFIPLVVDHNQGYKQRRHSNLGHRAMGQVVFLPRPESQGAFWAVITHNIGSSLLNNFTK